ncbi:MAG: outer membrane protein assembly factor BamD [Nitrospirales bacterium]|nr:outer membrane protein assembly factor BamD [Nitrospirales bacterium]
MPLLMLFFCLTLLLNGCGGKAVVKDEGPFDPEKAMSRAEKLIADKEYDEARRILVEVKNREESKKYAAQAQLKIADSHVQEGDPEVGIEDYRKFLELYPDSQYASFAQYQIAMAYFGQIEAPDRGSGAAEKALREFLVLKERYPRNPYREILDLRIEKCRNVMADGEFIVGAFYYKKGSYQSAIDRWEGLLGKFPVYKRADETLLLIGKAYKNLNMGDKARDAFRKLIESFPSSPFVSEAKKQL